MDTSRAPLVASSLLAAREVTELASGVDAFYLSGFGEVPARLFTRLEELKTEAMSAGEPVTFALGTVEFRVNPKGLPHYPVRLDHEYCAVGVTASRHLPALRFQPRAEVLHTIGPAGAAEWFLRTFEPAMGDLTLGVSRLDLFVDVQGWEPAAEDRHRFVKRARSQVTYEETEELTGFRIGTRKSGMTFRLYNKTEDAAKKRVGFWPVLWGERFDPSRPVWRAEAELHRAVLKQFGADTPSKALARVGSIWRYMTEEWLSLRVPTADATRSRWPVDPRWQVIQQASMANGAVPIERVSEANRRAELSWWLPRLLGSIASCGALIGANSAAEALDAVPGLVELYELQGGRGLEDRLIECRTARLAS